MDRRRALQVGAAAVVVLLVVGAVGVVVGWQFLGSDDHDNATVTVRDENGTELATVDARVADTFDERYTGLSETESLENGSGMLFVHDEEGTHTYVMRNMDFPIDIVFVDADGRITTIHHARAPRGGENGNDLKYPGRGKYVLEVPRGYTNATGIDEGDRVEIEFED
jgi:uncharacterized membrane protein (UPF0127 family)